MKLFCTYQHANITMVNDTKLIDSLKKLASQKIIDVIIETGTNLGLGSTKILAEIFNNKNIKIHTIEVNYSIYQQAKKNLSHFQNVTCHYGCSTKITEAINFIENDFAIREHEKYPDFFIDNIENPVDFYAKEIKGQLNLNSKPSFLNLKYLFRPKIKENLLIELINKHFNNNFLIVLDSAGGIGKLEFDTVNRALGNKQYHLLIDDTHHLKHFRSVEIIKNSNNWQIIDFDNKYGWLLAKHLI